ncbi:sensor histidine kinase/response regulator [Pedobacter sp. BAL39]|uniref:ligand-binding sensor domain-containing protein n=1 Tax=Pedobacter sp. BAL39 TaxID=391596 RepID=UPI00015594C4|nr:two-component regulator propeller domain-containing protein [Pedobacter sp. BAL39]EDM37660.1 sensor histidine kinase/response regulator [Pedobacter sp. BAL39]
MKNKTEFFSGLLIIMAVVIYFPVQAQRKNRPQDVYEVKGITAVQGPHSIVRTIKQDRKGNIWIASWQGIFKYDGKSFTNITSKVSSARFFSVLEDRKGNFWFASVGSGVYYYNGRSFRNFTTKDGLANDRVTNIYEDKTGNIWFGTEGGASLYDGKFFRNFKIKERSSGTQADSVHISAYQKPLSEQHWMHNDVNAIIEDKTGKLWFGTRGYAYVYDGKTFTTIINNDGKPFTNVRSIIKDKKGNIWLGGHNGLWRYDGSTFTNFTRQFVGYVYEDKKGNIWTSSENANESRKALSVTADGAGWVLSRYDEKSLFSIKPTVTEVTNKPMIFGILEDDKGDVLFGTFDGVYRYDGSAIQF